MKAFYLNITTNNWELVHTDGTLEKLNAGTCTLLVSADRTIVYIYLGTERKGKALITDLIKNPTTGAKYADWADFDITTKDFFVKAPSTGGADVIALTDRVAYLELHAYDTLWIDSWGILDDSIGDGGIAFDASNNTLWCLQTDGISYTWLSIPLSISKLYINRTTNEVFSWSGSAMVAVSSALTKSVIESLIGTNPTHTHFNQLKRTIALAAFDIDLSLGEDFTKLTGMATPTTFTINAVGLVLKKPFRLFLTGGTLAVPTFTGYTTHWLASTAVTDYVPATNPNVLYCEVREANHIYLFWGE